jgi:PBSX family phage portal protein
MTDRAEAVEDDEQDLVEVAHLNLGDSKDFEVYEDKFAAEASSIVKLNGLTTVFKRKSKRQVGSKAIQDDVRTGYNLFDVQQPPYNMDYLAALYELSGYYRGAVDAKVTNTVGLGYDLIETDMARLATEDLTGPKLKRSRAKKARAKAEVMAWLDTISEDNDVNIVLRNAYLDYLTTGNGYLEVGRTVTGEIAYFGHIPATTMRVRTKKDGFVQIIGKKAVFFRNFEGSAADPIGGDSQPNEVIHLKNYSPTNSAYGVPEIISARTSVAGNEFSGRFNLDYFEHKAAPRYVIVTKNAKWSEQSLNDLMEFLEGNIKGKNHRTVVIPLSSEALDKKIDFEMKPVENGVQEGSFKGYRQDNRDEILFSGRTPITKLGIPAGVSLAAARDADKTFKEQVCRPEQGVLNKKISRVVANKTDAFTFKLNELDLADEKTQAEIDKVYLTTQTMTPNEVRARKGLAPLPGGDKVIELKPQEKADQKKETQETDARSGQRSANASDSAGEARNPKGEGRQAP